MENMHPKMEHNAFLVPPEHIPLLQLIALIALQVLILEWLQLNAINVHVDIFQPPNPKNVLYVLQGLLQDMAHLDVLNVKLELFLE